MAKRSVVKRIAEELADAIESDETAQPEQAEIDLNDFLSDVAPSTSVVDIFRMKNDGTRPHIDKTSMDVLRADLYGYLREIGGTGKFLLQFKGADRRVIRTKVVDVEAPRNIAPTMVQPANNGAVSPHDQFIREQLAQQQTLMTTLISGLVARPQLPAPDPAAMLSAVVGAFTALKGATSNGDGDPIAKAKTILELVNELREPVSDNHGGGGPDNLWSFLGQVGKQVVTMLPGLAHNGATPPQQLTGASGAAAIPVTTSPAGPTPEVNAVQQQRESAAYWIRTGLNYLKAKSAAGKDVEFFVESILENDDEPQNAALISALEQGATFDHLLQFDPEIGQNPTHAAWFRKLYDGLHAEIFAPVDSIGSVGNPSDPGSDGGPGAA